MYPVYIDFVAHDAVGPAMFAALSASKRPTTGSTTSHSLNETRGRYTTVRPLLARYHYPMKLELNPEGLQTAMELWRKTVEMEIPLAPHLRSHFLLQRGSLLEGFVKTANNWLMVLNNCKPTDENDTVDLRALKEEILSFKSWAEQGVSELVKLTNE